MTLAAFADLAEVVGALGVIASLIFVGVQLRQNTKQMQRGEANSAMAQGSAYRHLILNNRQTAELVFKGVSGAPLDPVDEMRLNALFTEIVYMTLHVWDRARNDLVPKDELTRIAPAISPAITSARGLAWWARARTTMRPDFVADLEVLLPALKARTAARSASSAPGAQSGETAVAPPADAG